MDNQFDIGQLSPHLFWDVDKDNLNIETHFRYIIQKVLEFGLLKDWLLLYKTFGIKRIVAEAQEIGSLDKRTASFLAHISDTNIESFKCYTLNQSIPKHWNF